MNRLAGAGVVQVAERGDLEPTDLVAVVGVVASAMPERDVPPGQLPDLGVQDRMVLLHDGHVVRAATGQIGPVVVLGVQGVGGHHRVLQLETVQQRHEGGISLPLEATCRWARTTPWWSIAASS